MFPAKGKGFELWTTSSILAAASDYFSSVGPSSFASTDSARKSKRAKTIGPSNIVLLEDEEDFTDSGDEANQVILKALKSDSEEGIRSPSSSEADHDFTYPEVEVKKSAYSTYRAVVVYLLTKQISWAPLRSAFDSSESLENAPSGTPSADLAEQISSSMDTSTDPTAFPTRSLSLFSRHLSDPHLPLPVSPKSVYRLAHRMGLPALQDLALDAFEERLTVATVATELFGDALVQFQEICEVAMQFAAANWAEVIESEGWKSVAERVRNEDDVPATTAKIAFELLGRTRSG